MALPLHPATVGYVLANLRPCDAAEVWPVCPDGTTTHGLAQGLALSPVGRVFLHDGIPAAAIGAAECHPGAWTAWMVATDAWPQVARAVFRYARGPMRADMIGRGAHRAQVVAACLHPDAARFLAGIGFVREGVMRALGRDRQDYEAWAYVVPA